MTRRHLAVLLLPVAILVGGCDDDVDDPCGIPTGARCVDGFVLERCVDGRRETVDCDVTGDVCAPSPEQPAQGACVRPDTACGSIERTGACSGPVLAYCGAASKTLVVYDCGATFASCLEVGGERGFDCQTPCDTADVSAGGVCVGGDVRRCVFADGAYDVTTESCPEGTVCRAYAETQSPVCLAQDACTGVGPQGACQGNVLVRCQAGTRVETDCAVSGEVCAHGGAAGYVCAPPGAAGALVARGVVRYEDRPPTSAGTLARARLLPARGAAVAIVRDQDGAVLAAGATADDGSYALRYDAPAGEAVHVLAASVSPLPERPVRVIRPDGLVHGIASPGFAAAAEHVQDVTATDVSGVAPAFNLLDVSVTSMDAARALLGIAEPQPVYLVWARGFAPDTTKYGGGGVIVLGTTHDDDGWDDAVIGHELGHWFETSYARRDASGGGPHGSMPADPRLAWSEGLATYWGAVVRNDPAYIDTNAFGSFQFHVERDVTTADPAMPVTQPIREQLVSELLWDVGDAPSPDDDGAAAGHASVLAIETGYLRTLSETEDRGAIGIDLVDWLDGWLDATAPTGCDALRPIVEARTFPYDFAGCP